MFRFLLTQVVKNLKKQTTEQTTLLLFKKEIEGINIFDQSFQMHVAISQMQIIS